MAAPATTLVKLQIKNFKDIAEKDLDFTQFSTIVGGNASGKSQVVEAFGYVTRSTLERCTRGENVMNTSVTMTVRLPNQTEKTFRRAHCSEGERCFVDGQFCGREAYSRKLLELNINPLAIDHSLTEWNKLVDKPAKQLGEFLEKHTSTKKWTDYRKAKEDKEKEQKKGQTVSGSRRSAALIQASKKFNQIHAVRLWEFQGMLGELNPVFAAVHRIFNESETATLTITNKKEPFRGVKISINNGHTTVLPSSLGGKKKEYISFALMVALNLHKEAPFLVVDNIDKIFDFETAPDIIPKLAEFAASPNGIQLIGTATNVFKQIAAHSIRL